MEELNLHIPELIKTFSSRCSFRKTDLRDFFRSRWAELPENAFRRILYALEKRTLIRKIDRGVYTMVKDQSERKKFIPTFSAELSAIKDSIQFAFPYVKFLIWETRILHEFMLHQPGQNQIILETEKATAESLFNFLNDRHEGTVFLQPERVIFERYILPKRESIIVFNLITQSPHQKVNDIPCPRIEKILVDIFTDDKIFYLFQGHELAHIFETVFERYLVSEKALFRYAERRKVGQKILTFITRETMIRLNQQEERNP